MQHILIVEDENIIRAALTRLLEMHDYQVSSATSVNEAESLFDLHSFDLIISDFRLPGSPGTDIIGLAPSVPVVIMTSYASMRSAVDAMKMGAVDYIAKPFSHEDMLTTVRSAILQRKNTDVVESPATPETVSPDTSFSFIGQCQPIQSLFNRISKVARTEATVLVLGESGTGKELAAKAIHEQSERADKPMICVNCASIPDSLIESELFGHEKGAFTGANATRNGLIEAADGGTLFLDEIGELPLEAQARLLRFLQEGEIRKVGSVKAQKVDVRLIAATHRDLKALAKTGDFREDLYYRLYVVELKMPPLRERGADIIELAEHFLKHASERIQGTAVSLSSDACELMLKYSWPGNVRELENAIERAVILAEEHLITAELLGLDVDPNDLQTSECSNQDLQTAQHGLPMDEFQRFVLENQHQMNETDLAKQLGISRKCLWERRQKLGIPRTPKG